MDVLNKEDYDCSLNCGYETHVSSLCPHVKDSYKRINQAIFQKNHPEMYRFPPGDMIQILLDKQVRNKRDLERNVEWLRRRLNGTVEKIRSNPTRASCTDYSTCAGLLVIAYDLYQDLKPANEPDLIDQIKLIQTDLSGFFKRC